MKPVLISTYWTYLEDLLYFDEFNFIAMATAAPEPATLWLLVAGALTLAVGRFLKK